MGRRRGSPRSLLLLGCWLCCAGLSAAPARAEDSAAAPALPRVPDSCLLTVPAGQPPADGWPVFLLLHGYGTNKEDLDDLARVVAGHGGAAIAVDAPTEIGGGRRSWDTGTEGTHAYLQMQIAPLRADPRLDFEPVHVGGFSQGGIRSLLLAATYPEIYGGVISISPAGGSWPEDPPGAEAGYTDGSTPRGRHPHPLRLIYGTQENPRMIDSARQARSFWEAWGEPWQVFTHPGGHHFPPNWEDVIGDGAAWILEESRVDRP